MLCNNKLVLERQTSILNKEMTGIKEKNHNERNQSKHQI
jgi:hypothetical protein